MKILITGGNGFIGSAVVRHVIASTDHQLVNVDKMTYAATAGAVASVADDVRYEHVVADVCDARALDEIFSQHQPDAVMHLAAESHVDRSIDGPADFVQTNLVGTFTLLEAARNHGVDRFHHVSTDEVYGSLGFDDPAFREDTPYSPHSPYSATKAGSDHLVRAWGTTYDLPVVVTNCSNNYGPFQFPEKLIPLITIRALFGRPLPVFGTGENVRDWLYVEDHADALLTVLQGGTTGETYNIGGNEERPNLAVVHTICDIIDDIADELGAGAPRRSLIEFTTDRPGHDLRYAIDQQKIEHELHWRPSVSFEEGLRRTIEWYVANQHWWEPLLNDDAIIRRGVASTP